MALTKGLAKHIACAIDPVFYAKTIGLDLFPWQEEAVCPDWLRLLLLCARQSGKTSRVLGLLGAWTAKFYPGRPIPVICPAKHQSRLVLDSIKAVMAMDRDYPALVGEAIYEVETEHGSRIIGMPGTERSVRGVARPALMIFDEDGLVPDSTYRAARPMMLGADTKLILSGTAHGQRGHFYDTADSGDPELWHKMLVRSPWDAVGGKLQDHAPEDRFREHWKRRGWSAHYSDRHKADRAFVEEEAQEGQAWYDQEHACAFLSSTGSLFDVEDLRAAHSAEVIPLLRQMTGLNEADENNYSRKVEALR